MSEAATHDRWTRRLLLLACAVGGLWLVGLLGHAGQAQAEVLRPVTTRPAASAPVVPARTSIAAAAPAVSATVEKTVLQTVKPVGHLVQTVLNSTVTPAVSPVVSPVVAGDSPVLAPIAKQVVAPVVTKVVSPVVAPIAKQVVAPVVTKVVSPVVAPVLLPVVHKVVEPIVAPVAPIAVAPIAIAPIVSRPVLGHPVAGAITVLDLAGHRTVSTESITPIAQSRAVTGTAVASSVFGTRPAGFGLRTPAAPAITPAGAARIHRAVAPTTPYPAPQPLPLPAPAVSPAGSTATSAHQFNGTFDLTSDGGLALIGTGSLRVQPGSLLAPRNQAYCPSVSPD